MPRKGHPFCTGGITIRQITERARWIKGQPPETELILEADSYKDSWRMRIKEGNKVILRWTVKMDDPLAFTAWAIFQIHEDPILAVDMIRNGQFDELKMADLL